MWFQTNTHSQAILEENEEWKTQSLRLTLFLFCEIEKLNETQKWRRKSGCRMKQCNNAEWCHVDCYFNLHAVVNEKLLPKRVGLNH